ncbi:hypothetical protein BC835DRAFT_1419267 [Cytidiella melzeri]|nr:hypothetical protein BC835DRAFT_1419267 [Cytidiella melzeri]
MSEIPQSSHSEASTFEADVAPMLPPFISGSAEVQENRSMDSSVHSVLAATASPLQSGSPTTDIPRTDGCALTPIRTHSGRRATSADKPRTPPSSLPRFTKTLTSQSSSATTLFSLKGDNLQHTTDAVKSLQVRFLDVVTDLETLHYQVSRVNDKYSKTVKESELYRVTLDISEIEDRLAALENQVTTAKVALAKRPSVPTSEFVTWEGLQQHMQDHVEDRISKAMSTLRRSIDSNHKDLVRLEERTKELSMHYEQLDKQLGSIHRKLSLYAPKLSNVVDNIEAVTSLCEDTFRISQQTSEGLRDVHEELPTALRENPPTLQSELQQSSAGANVSKNQRKGLFPSPLARDSLPKRRYSLESIDRAFPKIDHSRVAGPAPPDSPATGTLHGDPRALAWESSLRRRGEELGSLATTPVVQSHMSTFVFTSSTPLSSPRPWQPQAQTMQGISGAEGGECEGESDDNGEREGGTAMREGGSVRTELNKGAGVTDRQEDGETDGEQGHAKEDERKGDPELTDSRVKTPPTATKPSVGEVLEMLFPELAQGVRIYAQDLRAYTVVSAVSIHKLSADIGCLPVLDHDGVLA